jgi:hypothetical protein
MSPDPELLDAVRRAGARAAYHLLRAGVESLKALEAVIDELGSANRRDPAPDGDHTGGRQRIDLE